MSEAEIAALVIVGGFLAVSIGFSVCYLCKKLDLTAAEAVRLLWTELWKKPKGTAKMWFKTAAKTFVQVVSARAAAWRIRNRRRHEFTVDLWAALAAIVEDYRYKRLDYDMWPVAGLPSHIYIGFTAQKALSEDLVQEVATHLLLAFRQYLAAYGLHFPSFAFPYADGSSIEVYIYYCEYAEELPFFQEKKRQIVRSNTTPSFGLIEEDVQPKAPREKIVLGYAAEKWDRAGIMQPVTWDYRRFPSLLIAGNTGQGKSVVGELVCKQLLEQSAELTICDYKSGGDWLGVSARYAERNECGALLEQFYREFCATLESKLPSTSPKVLVFDEFSDYALTRDAKEFKDLMAKIGEIAMMGRAFNYHLIFIGQSFSAKVIDTGLRDQFGTRLAVGSLGAEAWSMIFPGVDYPKEAVNPFHGYATTPERGFEEVIFPKLKDVDALRERLQEMAQEGEK